MEGTVGCRSEGVQEGCYGSCAPQYVFFPAQHSHTCWCYMIKSLRSQGLGFPGGAAQKTTEMLGAGETVQGSLRTPRLQPGMSASAAASVSQLQ